MLATRENGDLRRPDDRHAVTSADVGLTAATQSLPLLEDVGLTAATQSLPLLEDVGLTAATQSLPLLPL